MSSSDKNCRHDCAAPAFFNANADAFTLQCVAQPMAVAVAVPEVMQVEVAEWQSGRP